MSKFKVAGKLKLSRNYAQNSLKKGLGIRGF